VAVVAERHGDRGAGEAQCDRRAGPSEHGRIGLRLIEAADETRTHGSCAAARRARAAARLAGVARRTTDRGTRASSRAEAATGPGARRRPAIARPGVAVGTPRGGAPGSAIR